MKRVTVAQFRKNLAAYLDDAAAGKQVLVESRGRRVVLGPESSARTARSKAPRMKNLVTWVDPAVEAGQWRWDWSPGKLVFVDTRPRNRK